MDMFQPYNVCYEYIFRLKNNLVEFLCEKTDILFTSNIWDNIDPMSSVSNDQQKYIYVCKQCFIIITKLFQMGAFIAENVQKVFRIMMW